jgi:hypothetical protein
MLVKNWLIGYYSARRYPALGNNRLQRQTEGGNTSIQHGRINGKS